MLKNNLEQNHIFAPEPPESFSQNKKEHLIHNGQLNKGEARESQIKAVEVEKNVEDRDKNLIYYLEEIKQIALTAPEKKWLKMLVRDGVLSYQDDYIIFDYQQYSQPRFTHKYYIGSPDERPTRQMLEKILTGVKFVLKSDYEQGKIKLLDFNSLYFRQKRQQFIERLIAAGVLEKKITGWFVIWRK